MGQKKLSLAQNAAYNTVGSIFYSFCQWLITLIVVRFSGNYENAGILQLSISVTNVFSTVSLYSLRTYQISDTKGEFKSREYIAVSLTTALLALVLCALYALISGYSGTVLLCVIVYMLFKATESVVDVFYGIDQKNNRMDIIGFSFILRGILSVGAFSAVYILSGNILQSIIAQVFGAALVILLFDVPASARFGSVLPLFSKTAILGILKKCFPAVISLAVFTAIVTLPRQFLSALHGEEILGYYATVATPIVVIQLLATGVFYPLLNKITAAYQENDYSALENIFIKVFVGVLIFAAVFFAGAALFGEFALTLVYGEGIKEYCYLMYAVIGCAVLYAACWLVTNVLIIMRKMIPLMVISIICFLPSLLMSKSFIHLFYINGVSFCIIFCYACFIIAGAGTIYKELQEK